MTTTTSTSRRSSSDDRLTVAQRHGAVHVRCSTLDDGDFHRTEVALAELEPRRRGFVDLPWTMLDQRHGVSVVRVRAPGDGDGALGDVAVTTVPGAVLGCWVGDCAPVVLIGADREVAVVHAGWRGLAAGVIDVAVAALDEPVVAAVLGPVIGACCYEFGAADLRQVADGTGADVSAISGRTSWGTLALDVRASVTVALARHGVRVRHVGGCTGCSFPGFSHRARGDRGRHVVAAWREEVG